MKKISRRNFLKGAAVLGTAAAMTACGGSSSSTSTAASTSAAASTGAASAAEASGKLVIYSPNSDTQIDCTLTNGFMVKYPNIEVELQSMGTGDVLARIEAEKENPQADIDWGAINFNFYKQHPDLWESYVSPNEANLDENYRNNTDGNVTYCNLSGSGCFILNNTMLKELGVEVKGYADLLQPELKGKIAMGDPTASSSAFAELTNMLLAMGGYEDDAAWKYVEDLFVGQKVAITSGSSAVYKGVYNGEYAVGLTYEDPCVTLIKDGATNIQVVYPVEGTVFLPAQIGIVKNAKNVENAKAFVDFMLSEDAQRFLAENTTSRNVREVEYKNDVMTPLADIKLIYEDSDYVIAHTSELKEKVQDIMMDM